MEIQVNAPHELSRLGDAGLFREQAYINGGWVAAPEGKVIEVTNPATGEAIGVVPDLNSDAARAAIEAAQMAFPLWKALLPQERSHRLLKWYDLMITNRDDLALLLTLEQGKPLDEAKGEIDYAASFVQWFAEEAKRVGGESITPHLPNRKMMLKWESIGVTAAITPWNFPSAMITRKAAAALAAGCPVVVRPASETPYSALALAELADRAGIPRGVFSVVTGDAEQIVNEFCHDQRVRVLSFTGSTEVGRKLLALAAPSVKRMSMELGGHAPFIVFSDVNLEDAVQSAIKAKFQTTGQDCLAANRIYVHEPVYDDFCCLFAEQAGALKLGNGLDPGVVIGPLMHERALRKCEAHVRDALDRGARLLAGGGRHALGGLFFEPTVLADASDDMALSIEETFGPVAGIFKFVSEEEVILRANNTIFGLAAYLWTHDSCRAERLAAALEYGMVAINCVKFTGPPVPFGGMKQSGLGREGSRYGLREFAEIKYICSYYNDVIKKPEGSVI